MNRLFILKLIRRMLDGIVLGEITSDEPARFTEHRAGDAHTINERATLMAVAHSLRRILIEHRIDAD